jgi:hypothetical protein
MLTLSMALNTRDIPLLDVSGEESALKFGEVTWEAKICLHDSPQLFPFLFTLPTP